MFHVPSWKDYPNVTTFITFSLREEELGKTSQKSEPRGLAAGIFWRLRGSWTKTQEHPILVLWHCASFTRRHRKASKTLRPSDLELLLVRNSHHEAHVI